MTFNLTGRQVAELSMADLLEITKTDAVCFDANGTEITRFELDNVVKIRWQQKGTDGRVVRTVNVEVYNQ